MKTKALAIKNPKIHLIKLFNGDWLWHELAAPLPSLEFSIEFPMCKWIGYLFKWVHILCLHVNDAQHGSDRRERNHFGHWIESTDHGETILFRFHERRDCSISNVWDLKQKSVNKTKCVLLWYEYQDIGIRRISKTIYQIYWNLKHSPKH